MLSQFASASYASFSRVRRPLTAAAFATVGTAIAANGGLTVGGPGPAMSAAGAAPFVRVVSYNVLSSHLCAPDHFLRCAPDALDPPQRLARIPPTWRLQVYVGSFEGVSYGFAREDVTAASTIRDVEAAMRRGLPSHSHRTRAASDAPCAPRLELWLGGARLSPDETAEEARLFTRRGALTAKVLPCVPAAGGAGAALARAEDHKVAEDDARRASAPGAGSTASSSPRVSGREGTLSEAPVLALAAPP